MAIRIQKILAETGRYSRREAEALIKEGIVQCNGQVVQLGDKADPEKDIIKVSGKKIPAAATAGNGTLYLWWGWPWQNHADGYVCQQPSPS